MPTDANELNAMPTGAPHSGSSWQVGKPVEFAADAALTTVSSATSICEGRKRGGSCATVTLQATVAGSGLLSSVNIFYVNARIYTNTSMKHMNCVRTAGDMELRRTMRISALFVLVAAVVAQPSTCSDGEQSDPKKASKAAASKVAPDHSPASAQTPPAGALSQQHQQEKSQEEKSQQPTPSAQQAATPPSRAWLPHLQRGMMMQQREQWADAITAYEEALKLFDPKLHADAERVQFAVSANTNLGLALQNAQRPTDAVTAFDAALAAHPSNADGHHNRGNALYAGALYEEAAAAYTRALELNERDAESYFRLGNSYDKLERPQDAAKAFALALSLDPSDASAAYNLANAYRTLGRTDEAIAMYKDALKATPQDAAKHANLGHALDSAGKYDEAAAAFGAALTLAPTDAGTYTSLGHAHKSAGRTEDAVAAYQAALVIAPNAAGAYAGLGGALKAIDPKRAAEAFAAAAESDAGGEEADQAKKLRAWLDMSPAPLPSSRPEGAREWSTVAAAAVYPDAFESRASACPSMPMAAAVEMGAEALMKLGPTLLRNASEGWRLSGWSDGMLEAEVGHAPMRMLVMPTDVHPTLDVSHKALVEPAASGVYFGDYLRLLDRLATTEEFSVYVAQLNLLRLPPLLRQVCLPKALPSSRLTMANLWVGGHSMKNGLHFDNCERARHRSLALVCAHERSRLRCLCGAPWRVRVRRRQHPLPDRRLEACAALPATGLVTSLLCERGGQHPKARL